MNLEKIGNDTLNVVIASSSKNLNRYTINTGKIYGNSINKYKIVKVLGDTIFYKNLSSQKIESSDVDKLLERWKKEGIKEIAFIDEIIETIRGYLEPILGPFVMGGLIAWLWGKLK